jgi:hypothetical protein
MAGVNAFYQFIVFYGLVREIPATLAAQAQIQKIFIHGHRSLLIECGYRNSIAKKPDTDKGTSKNLRATALIFFQRQNSLTSSIL